MEQGMIPYFVIIVVQDLCPILFLYNYLDFISNGKAFAGWVSIC